MLKVAVAGKGQRQMKLQLTDWMFSPLWCRKILELVFLTYNSDFVLPGFTDEVSDAVLYGNSAETAVDRFCSA